MSRADSESQAEVTTGPYGHIFQRLVSGMAADIVIYRCTSPVMRLLGLHVKTRLTPNSLPFSGDLQSTGS